MNENKHQRRDDQRPGVKLDWGDAQAAPIKTWRERIGVTADYPLHLASNVERAMEEEISELRTRISATSPVACAGDPIVSQYGFIQLELDDDLREILGRPNFTCRDIAVVLRLNGREIKGRAEDEQAATIHFLLNFYLRHGTDWWEHAREELGRMVEVAKTSQKEGGAS